MRRRRGLETDATAVTFLSITVTPLLAAEREAQTKSFLPFRGQECTREALLTPGMIFYFWFREAAYRDLAFQKKKTIHGADCSIQKMCFHFQGSLFICFPICGCQSRCPYDTSCVCGFFMPLPPAPFVSPDAPALPSLAALSRTYLI